MKLVKKTRSRLLGAALAEFALVLPFILFFLVAIIDLSRYIAARAVLTRGAQSALEAAIRIRNFDLEVTTNSGSDWNNYLSALDTIRDTGLRIATGAFLSPSSGNAGGGYANLVPANLLVGANSLQAPPSDVLVLRPGDRGTIGSAQVLGVPLANGQNFSQAIRERPLVVEMRAQIKMLTPLLGTVTIVGRAAGYRENPPTKLRQLGTDIQIPCGDGVVQASLGEQCDGGPNCNSECQRSICGDGTRTTPEEGCDPSDYAVNPAAWARYCYPPNHPDPAKRCQQITSNREPCGATNTSDPIPPQACCGDGVQQTTEVCDSSSPTTCTNGVCTACDLNNCTISCSGGSCPAGTVMRYASGFGCRCVSENSMNN